MFRLPAILFGVLTALPAVAELVPLGDWPVDETRAALQVEGELFRNCGRVLERWDVVADPPLLLDSLILDSPPVDLLDWDGLLLVQRDDGVLEARDPAADWSQPVWTLALSECVSELHRIGPWLLPVSPYYQGVNLSDPRQPEMSNWVLDGDDQACWVNGHWVGNATDCCGVCWDIFNWSFSLPFADEGPDPQDDGPGQVIPSWGSFDLAACDSLLAVAEPNRLSLVHTSNWQEVVSQDLPGTWEQDEVCLATRDFDLAVSLPTQLLVYRLIPHTGSLVLLGELDLPGGRDLRWTADGLLVTAAGQTALVQVLELAGLVVEWVLPAAGPLQSVARCGDRLLARHQDLWVLEQVGDSWLPSSRLELGTGAGLVADGTLALADSDSLLLVLDLADPLQPEIAATLPLAPNALFALDGTRVAVADSLGLQVYDVMDPAMPYLLGAATLARPKNLSIAEGIVAVQNQEDVVQLFDVRDASTLEPAGQIHFPPHPPSFWQRHESFCGTRLLLACTALVEGIERSEVRFWNVADPHSPVSEGLWYRNWEDLEQFEVGPDRLLVCSQPMAWGISPIYSLLDVIEESQPNQTAMWFGQWGVLPRPRHAVLEGGWLASWTTGDGLRMQLDDSILSVEAPPTRPASLTLSAAPNPFNPVTRLELTLAQAGPVRLAVYDLLGREVAVLLDGTCAAGARSLAFDAAALASGVYFARLETAAGSQTLKLALVR